MNSKKSSKKIGLILIFSLVILIAAYIAYNLFLISTPVIEGTEAFNSISADKTITLKGKNLKSIDISINQGAKKISLLKDAPAAKEKTYTLQIKPKDLNLMDGSAIVIVDAKAGIFKKVRHEINSTIDTIPPALEILNTPSFVNQGSSGFAVLKAKDADSVFIKLEDYTFKTFKAPAGTESARGSNTLTYSVFFAAPFNSKEGSVFYAVAYDAAGNKNIKSLPTKLKGEKFKISTINIDDAFVNRVVSPLLNETNISDPVSAFKKANENLRESNLKKLIEIGQKSEPKILWGGPFLQLKNSKVMATYGDKRTYFYKEKPISSSVHLGYDLASTENAMVEAANSGIVRYAGDLGIYGNTIIIDHGLGLMSLYGHLSTILVKEGQAINKGEIIARTGSTGLAGGDHLHFGILMHGYEVTPLPWWDAHWIKVNILDYLKQ
ncbi:MAG: M23 family metallopeptidase [Thermodesulfovibrionia bacterium]|nr:M23 family metallopeptidase [Thermodesulfovibrionia bacterium]